MKKSRFLLLPLSLLFFLITLIPVFTTSPNRAFAQNDDQIYLPLILKYGQMGHRLFLPLIQRGDQPLYSTSYYMKTVDDTFLFNLGCELGTRDQQTPGTQDSVVVLDFSYPICPPDGTLGAELFGFGPVPLNDISNAVKNFGLGYYACSGTDQTSSVVVGIGTNNKPYSCDSLSEARTHGAAWANMVNDVNAWYAQQGLFHQVQAYAASDMELGWNGPGWTRAWLDAYDGSNQYPMLHFGDAAGCPYDERPYLNCGTSSYPEWESEDVWYISWGSPPALPLPLIYLTNGIHAKQWAFLSQYGVAQHGARMDFTGVFTQYQACQQWGCNGTDNTPEEAYIQLLTELGKDPATRQPLRWKTDIRWILNSELPPPPSLGSMAQPEPIDLPQKIETLETMLLNPDISPTMKQSITEKIETFTSIFEQTKTSNRFALIKDEALVQLIIPVTDPPFVKGIFPGGTSLILPWRAPITNTFQTQRDSEYLQVVAGSSPHDETRGALYVIQTSQNKKDVGMDIILAPEGTAQMTILAETLEGLLVEDIHGIRYIFDLSNFGLEIIGNGQ